MSRVLLRAKEQTAEVLYSHKFDFETLTGSILEIEANHTLKTGQLMVALDGDFDEVERYKLYVQNARELFKCMDDGEDVSEYVTDATMVQLFVMYIEHFHDSIKEAIESMSGRGNTPSRRIPKGLQSKSTTKPKKY